MATPGFDERYERATRHVVAQGSGGPSAQVEPLLRVLAQEIERRPPDLLGLKDALVALLEFLTSPEGRTDANCRVVDAVAGPLDPVERPDLPKALTGLLEDLCLLHDTFGAPATTRNFESTPEQLLARARRL